MQQTPTLQVDSAIEQLRQQLDDWRQTHRAPTPIPAEIWTGAVELAQKHGLNYVARSLSLGYGSLKRRVERHVDPSPAFLEWFAPSAGSVAECSFVVESERGPKVQVEVKNATAHWLASVLRELLN